MGNEGGTMVGKLRPEEEEAHAWFSERMKKNLEANAHKSGWEDLGFEDALDCVFDEIGEMRGAEQGDDFAQVASEAADAANFLMMIADNARQWFEEE